MRITARHLMLLALVFVLVPFLAWYGTWFGRPLTDSQINENLRDPKARKVQHALWKIAERIQKNDTSVRQFYPQVSALARSPLPEVRINVAWVMGQDNQSAQFHQALLPMLDDSDPLVRRNAALALVRFQDTRGKPEIIQMLRPFTMRAPGAGTVSFRLKEEDSVGRGTLLGRVSGAEIRSPLPGYFQKRLVKDQARVSNGDPLLQLSPSPEQAWEALRALYLIGSPEDLPDVQRYVSPTAPRRIQEQASLTAQAIRQRGPKD